MESSLPEVLMFPITSFPYILNSKPELQESFLLDFNVRPGWIVYNPNAVTVLSRNEMFQPVYELAPIWNAEKQVFKVKCFEDLEALKEMLEKPLVFCITRRQECEAMVNGFDTDFVIVLHPKDPKIAKQINRVFDQVKKRLSSGQKFCLKIAFDDLCDELTKTEFKNLVYWLNCEFYITNHSTPCQFLQLNSWQLWLLMFPVFLVVSLPYRAVRKTLIHDDKIHLHFRLVLKFCPETILVLHFYSANSRPSPGRYLTEEKKYIERDCNASEVRTLACLTSPSDKQIEKAGKKRVSFKKIKPKVLN